MTIKTPDSRKTLIEEAVRRTITLHRLWDFETPIVVAVSGGADSIALLHILSKLCINPSESLIVAHLDHAARTDSHLDREFVEDISHNLSIRCFSDRLSGKNFRGSSKEAYWRHHRYSYLEKIRKQNNALSIATAHTLDDQVETIVFRLISGVGPRGLIGIRINDHSRVIRPLLPTPRADIIKYLHDNQISFREDPTNQDTDYPRNYIRKFILPHLKNMNPAYGLHILQMSLLLEEEDRWISSEAQKQLSKSGWTGVLPCTLNGSSFQNCPLPILKRMALSLITTLPLPDNFRITHTIIDYLVDIFKKNRSELRLPLNIRIRVYRDDILITQFQPLLSGNIEKIPVKIPGITMYRTGKITSEVISLPPGFDLSSTSALYLSSEKQTLFIRQRIPGDRLIPFGKRSAIKLKDYFNRKNIPWELRDAVPLIVDEFDQILAVIGVDIAQPGAVPNGMKTAIKLTWDIR